MSYLLVNSPAVKVDIIEATDYYKKINPELAKQFLFRVREAKRYIANYPQGFEIKYNVVRTLLLRQFPYHIHFIIDDSHKQVIIIAIIHAYRNPQDFTER